MVLDAKYDVLAWNPLAAALLEDFSAHPRRDRNIIRRYFLGDPYRITSEGDFGRFAAGHLRTVAARYPHDPATQELIRDLLRLSPEFAALWPDAELPDQRHLVKTVDHPQIGPITLTCDILLVPEQDQHVVLFTAEPGTPAHDAMRLLSVVGLQQMT